MKNQAMHSEEPSFDVVVCEEHARQALRRLAQQKPMPKFTVDGTDDPCDLCELHRTIGMAVIIGPEPFVPVWDTGGQA